MRSIGSGVDDLRGRWRAAVDAAAVDSAADRVDAADDAVAEEVALSSELERGLHELETAVLAVAERRLGGRH